MYLRIPSSSTCGLMEIHCLLWRRSAPPGPRHHGYFAPCPWVSSHAVAQASVTSLSRGSGGGFGLAPAGSGGSPARRMPAWMRFVVAGPMPGRARRARSVRAWSSTGVVTPADTRAWTALTSPSRAERRSGWRAPLAIACVCAVPSSCMSVSLSLSREERARDVGVFVGCLWGVDGALAADSPASTSCGWRVSGSPWWGVTGVAAHRFVPRIARTSTRTRLAAVVPQHHQEAASRRDSGAPSCSAIQARSHASDLDAGRSLVKVTLASSRISGSGTGLHFDISMLSPDAPLALPGMAPMAPLPPEAVRASGMRSGSERDCGPWGTILGILQIRQALSGRPPTRTLQRPHRPPLAAAGRPRPGRPRAWP